MIEASQIVRHLLENEEDVDDLDVGLPFPIEDFLGRHRFVRAIPHDLGWEKVYDRGEFRFRVGHSQEDGTRTVQFIRGAMPLWTKHLTDEEIVEMIDRNSRIGEAEEDEFADEDVDAWKDVADHLSMMLETAGFVQRGANVWTFGINQWMSMIVTRLDEGRWQGKVNFQGVGAINEFEGSEVEIARWLEASERWPKFHFSDWNRFQAAAQGKTIRENEEEFSDEDWQDVTPVIEPILMRAGFSVPSDYPDKWVRVKERERPFKWVREVIWNDGQQWNYQAQTREQTGRWNTYAKEKFDTEGDLLWLLKTYRIADVGTAMQENEEEDFGEDDWKDVSPPVNASEIQRWCFTDYELREPKRCTGKDVFYANADGELAVIVLRDGTVTNMWEDGTVGVPDSVKQMADFDESPVKPSHRRTIDTDYYADNWCDVYVGKNGEFLGFILKESEEEEDFEDIREITQTNPVEEINTRFDRGRWIELSTAGPTSYIRRRYDGEEVVRWQIISWSNEDKAWRLVDTGKGVVEGEMEDVLNSADRLWAQP